MTFRKGSILRAGSMANDKEAGTAVAIGIFGTLGMTAL